MRLDRAFVSAMPNLKLMPYVLEVSWPKIMLPEIPDTVRSEGTQETWIWSRPWSQLRRQ